VLKGLGLGAYVFGLEGPGLGLKILALSTPLVTYYMATLHCHSFSGKRSKVSISCRPVIINISNATVETDL